MSEQFTAAFIELVRFIYKYHDKYGDFNGYVLGRFKSNYADSYVILRKTIDEEYQLTLPKLLSDLVSFYKLYFNFLTDVKSIDIVAVHLLDDMLSNEFQFSDLKLSIDYSDGISLRSLRSKIGDQFTTKNSTCQSSQNSSVVSFENSSVSSRFDNTSDNLILSNLKLLFNEFKTQIQQEMNSKLSNEMKLINDRISGINLNNTRYTSSQNSVNLTFNDIGVDEKTGFDLEKCINKKLRLQNKIKLLQSHIGKNTTPSSYFYGSFPSPYFYDDAEYVKLHNERIAKWQKEAMEQDIVYLQEKISQLDLEIDLLIQNYKDKFSKPPKDVVKSIESNVEIMLKPSFDKSTEKLNRIEARPYKVRVKSNSEPFSINGSNNSQTDNSFGSSSSSYRSNKRSKHENNSNQRYGFSNKRQRNQFETPRNSGKQRFHRRNNGFQSAFKSSNGAQVRFSQPDSNSDSLRQNDKQ